MLVYVATVVSILTGLAAVFAFGLGVTRTARLRRREQLYREALAAFSEDDQSKLVVAELQRAALSEIIARQLTSPWRVIWPWVAWVGCVAVAAQIGDAMSDYLASDAKRSYTDFAIKIFGDPAGPVGAIPVLSIVFYMVFYSYFHTIVGRAKVARNFYDAERLRRPETLTDLMRESVPRDRPKNDKSETDVSKLPWKARWQTRVQSAWTATVGFGMALVPGLFATTLGLTVGTFYWLDHRPGVDREKALASLGAWPGLVLLALSIFGTLMVTVIIEVAREVKKYSLPTAYPRSRIRLPGTPGDELT